MKSVAFALLAILGLGVLLPLQAGAAKPSSPKTSTPLGMDVSWPQCDRSLPSDHAFGIVGINGGLATSTNPCLADQLSWANSALGNTNQEKVQVYVNTANPGGLNTPSWPTSNVDPEGNLSANPEDDCDGRDTLACAWQYGWNRAVEDVVDRFDPAIAVTDLEEKSAAAYVWWLDVETENTWKTGGKDSDYQSNVAVLEGMTAYFKSRGIRVGLYSTAYQWQQIVGTAVTAGSNLNGLPNWRPGGASLRTAKDACSAAPLTANGNVILTQFISRNLDYNYVC